MKSSKDDKNLFKIYPPKLSGIQNKLFEPLIET